MRIALILLLLLALAAVPGSLVPQERVDALKASQWKDAHETLTPVYEKLGLFNVYGSPWFAAIYILLVISLVGCIVPRTFVYARGAARPAARGAAQPDPPAQPRVVRHDGVAGRGARAGPRRCSGASATGCAATSDGATVSAERGYLREVGNLLFHLAVLVVLVGFATGTLFGYKGGVILVQGHAVQQQPHAVRRLRARQPVRPRRDGPVLLHRRRLRRRVADVGPPGWRAGFDAELALHARRPATRRSPTTCGSTTR